MFGLISTQISQLKNALFVFTMLLLVQRQHHMTCTYVDGFANHGSYSLITIITTAYIKLQSLASDTRIKPYTNTHSPIKNYRFLFQLPSL